MSRPITTKKMYMARHSTGMRSRYGPGLLPTALVAHPNGQLIGFLFLFGLAVQVFESGFYKMCMWHLYYHEAENNDRSWLCRKLYQFSKCVERNCLIDTIFDLITFALFATATWMVFPIIYN